MTSKIVKSIYIVDNSSQKYIEDFCKDYDNAIYIASQNVGYGAGHNKAIRLAQQDKDVKYHLVLNSDVYFEPDVLDRIAEYMDGDEEVAQLQPYLTYPNGELQCTARLIPTPADLIFRRFLPESIGASMDERYTLSFWDHKTPANIAYHQGSFQFFRIKCFEKVGLYDERFFMYPDDIDITRRMHKYYKTMYCPKEQIAQLMDDADLLILQGGWGGMEEAVDKGKRCVVIPRIEGPEHIHNQEQLVRKMDELGHVVGRFDEKQLDVCVEQASSMDVKPIIKGDATKYINEALENWF